MGWLFVPGLGDWNSASGSSLPSTAPSCTWNAKPLPPRSWSRAWQRVSWLRRLSGTTCGPSTADAGVASWIVSLPDSPASRGVKPDPIPAPTMPAGSGRISSTALAKWDPRSSSWKMSLPLFPEEDWPPYSADWPTAGTLRNGVISPRPPLGHPMNACASSSWPTATASDSDDKWPTPASRDYKGENASVHLDHASGRKHLDQLPNFIAYCFPLAPPTPPGGVSSSPIGRTSPRHSVPRINVSFVEWLMGFPIGWTDSGLSATEWSRYRQRMRLSLWRLAQACGQTELVKR